MNFNLAEPMMLWLLLLVVVPMSLFLWWSWRKRQELVTQFIAARLLAQLKVGVSPSRQKLRMVLLVLSVVFLILALARPQWGYTWEEARQRGLDILVAIDTSNSMLAQDVPPNRLARAKLAALDLMRRARSDRLGLIAFAGDAFLVTPLTLDDSAFGQSVDSLDTHTISQGGTAIAAAIEAAQQAFKNEPENHRVLVLFTDGEDLDGGAVKAAEAAATDGMKIYTVGVGTAEGELLRITDEHGRTDYIRDESGNPVKSHLNEELLREIAGEAGGFYVPLRGTKTMDILYDDPHGLGSLPKTTTSTKMLRRFHERYQWPLALAIVLLVAEILLPDRKRRRSRPAGGSVSKSEEQSPRRRDARQTSPVAATATASLVILAIFLPLEAPARQGRALREYEQGDYQDALKDYDHLLENKKDDPRLHFNAGTAAYQSRQMDEAVKQFNESLNSQDLQLQEHSYYNLGNAYYRLGQQGGSPAAPGAGSGPLTGPAPAAGGPEAAQKAWEQALKQYESALKLNPRDEDAKFNHEFVQKRLEELKKQQQQQKQQNKSGDKQDKQNQQNQQNKNDSGQNQDKQQQQQSQQQDQKQNSSQQQNSQSQNQDQRQDQSAAEKQAEQQKKAQADAAEKKNQQDQSGKPEDKSQEDAQREAEMMAAGQMTPKQAEQLLDSQKSQDQVLHLIPPQKDGSSSPPVKNW
jgi:Ca-activated chloride channel family protein